MALAAQDANTYVEVVGTSSASTPTAFNVYIEAISNNIPTNVKQSSGQYVEAVSSNILTNIKQASNLYIEVLSPSSAKGFIGWGSPV